MSKIDKNHWHKHIDMIAFVNFEESRNVYVYIYIKVEEHRCKGNMYHEEKWDKW